MRYPPTRKDDLVEVLHGHRIADPYRWLEDPSAAETQSWIAAENQLTEDFLQAIPARADIHKRLAELWDYERYGLPGKEGGRYFYFKNDGLQPQGVLYVAPSLTGEPRVLLDPNTLSADGTVAVTGMAVSRDGRRLAYGLSNAGSDWQEWRVRDVDSGEDLADHLRWVRFSGVSWTPDGAGFYYCRYDEPPAGAAHTAVAYDQKLCYHRLGTLQSTDDLVYERPDHKEWGWSAKVSEDGRYLVVEVSEGTDPKNRVFYKDLSIGGPMIEILPEADAAYRFIGNELTHFWFWTDLEAPRGRVIEIDVLAPTRAAWRELIAERVETLQDVSQVGRRLVGSYLRDAHSHIELFGLDGTPIGDVALPGPGTAVGFSGHADDPETFFAFTSFTVAPTIYRCDVERGETEVFRAPRVRFDPAGYETRQVFFASQDGTRVPMFISHRKGLQPTGDAPTYLYGYGGFGISLTPAFEVGRLVWMELGGVLAVANLRGGGEYGEDWHQAGTRARKQNVFDDFIAAAQHLCASGVTSPARLAIGGGSNGGLLVGACLVQRPELFAAALPDVGVHDMLRFHKFTIGWAWTSDFGSPDDAADFEVLLAYSPLHNLEEGTAYPATLITAAETDDRVVPAHSMKFGAALQAAQGGDAPILVRIETKAGHGAGKPTAKMIATATDRWAFLVRVLGM